MTVDAVVIGGGVAGLQASLTLGRACRKVLLVDAGATRNRFAAHSQNLITRDGTPPSELVRLGRQDLAPYDVEIVEDRVVGVRQSTPGFEVSLAGGRTVHTGGVVAATGQRDVLTGLPGLAEVWGKSVFACPYCHGWEFRGQTFAVWGQDLYAQHMSKLIRAWSPDVHLLANGPLTWAAEDRAKLTGVTVHEQPVVGLDVEGGALRGVHFADGTRLALGALMHKPPVEPGTELLRSLGVTLTDEGLPKVDMMQHTSVPGVFAAGDLTSQMAALSLAIFTGSMAGAGLNAHLVGSGWTR